MAKSAWCGDFQQNCFSALLGSMTSFSSRDRVPHGSCWCNEVELAGSCARFHPQILTVKLFGIWMCAIGSRPLFTPLVELLDVAYAIGIKAKPPIQIRRDTATDPKRTLRRSRRWEQEPLHWNRGLDYWRKVIYVKIKHQSDFISTTPVFGRSPFYCSSFRLDCTTTTDSLPSKLVSFKSKYLEY